MAFRSGWISHVLEEAAYSVVVEAWDFGPGSKVARTPLFALVLTIG